MPARVRRLVMSKKNNELLIKKKKKIADIGLSTELPQNFCSLVFQIGPKTSPWVASLSVNPTSKPKPKPNYKLANC